MTKQEQKDKAYAEYKAIIEKRIKNIEQYKDQRIKNTNQ